MLVKKVINKKRKTSIKADLLKSNKNNDKQQPNVCKRGEKPVQEESVHVHTADVGDEISMETTKHVLFEIDGKGMRKLTENQTLASHSIPVLIVVHHSI